MSSKIYMQRGSRFSQTDKLDVIVHDALPPGNFLLRFHPEQGFYLEKSDDFKPILKLYGDTVERAERILNTMMERPFQTGVMLSGEKGSGKTLLARQCSLLAAEKFNMPTIIISDEFSGTAFNSFLAAIEQPAVILFDEFEKVYDAENQALVLSLLDGGFQSKKLFMFTINNEHKVDEHMLNRPGRVYYRLKFSGLSQEFIREYCEDALTGKDQIDAIEKLASMFSDFNFDMLKALVEELNRYGGEPSDALRWLNIDVSRGMGTAGFSVDVYHKGRKLESDEYDSTFARVNPLVIGRYYINIYGDEEKDTKFVQLICTPSNLLNLDPVNKSMIFAPAEGFEVRFLTPEKYEIDYRAF